VPTLVAKVAPKTPLGGFFGFSIALRSPKKPVG